MIITQFTANEIEQLAALFKQLERLILNNHCTFTLRYIPEHHPQIIARIRQGTLRTDCYLNEDYNRLLFERNCDECSTEFIATELEDDVCEDCMRKSQQNYEDGIMQSLEKAGGIL